MRFELVRFQVESQITRIVPALSHNTIFKMTLELNSIIKVIEEYPLIYCNTEICSS